MPKNRKQDSKGASWRETAEGRKTEKKQSWSFWPALNLGGWRRLALAPPIFPDFFLPQLRLSPPPLPFTLYSLSVTMDEEFSSGSADAEREITRLWRTWRTVFEMLQDRVCSACYRSPAKLTKTGLRGHRRRSADAAGHIQSEVRRSARLSRVRPSHHPSVHP